MKSLLIILFAAVLVPASITVTGMAFSGKYNLLPLAALIAVIYAVTFMLTRKGKIALTDHRRIWNTVLLISFLTTAVLGIILVLRVNYGIFLETPFTQLYWHVETGIVMAVVSVFHLLWHWRYYVCMFNSKKKCN